MKLCFINITINSDLSKGEDRVATKGQGQCIVPNYLKVIY